MRHSSCGGSRTQIAKKAFVFHWIETRSGACKNANKCAIVFMVPFSLVEYQVADPFALSPRNFL